MLLRCIYAAHIHTHTHTKHQSGNKYNIQKYCQHLMSTRIPANESMILIDMKTGINKEIKTG